MRVERHNASPTPTTLDALPMSTLNLLNDLTRLDQEIYDHALRLRQHRQKISWFTRLLRRR